VVQHPHAEAGRGPLRDQPADRAQAHDAEHPAGELRSAKVQVGQVVTDVPAGLAQVPIGYRDPPAERQQQADGEVRDRRGVAAGGVEDRHVARGTGGQIDVDRAAASGRHEPQQRQRL